MARRELGQVEFTPERLEEIDALLGGLELEPAEELAGRFEMPDELEQDRLALQNELVAQKREHREVLRRFVQRMTVASFVFLVVMVGVQMAGRWFDHDYTGVSDTVVNIVTVGVFGQIIGIVASIVLAVWRDPGEL